MPQRTLKDGSEPFTATILEAETPSQVVLFAVGGGGNPERHLGLLTALAALGCTVVAPHFERLAAPTPTDEELLLRTRRLRLVLDAVGEPRLPVAGVGHSIGAASLLALSGGKMWMRAGHSLEIATEERLACLVLLAPPTGFFRAPGALDAVRTPMLVWAGSQDPITPPFQAEFLETALGDRTPVDLRVTEGAGHFSFMDLPPPQSVEPLADRQAFLQELRREIGRFVLD